MKKIILFIIIILQSWGAYAQKILSPSGIIDVNFELTERGVPTYYVGYKNKPKESTSKCNITHKV